MPQNKQRLLDHQTRISTKQKHKEQSQKRRTCGAGGTMLPPAPLKKSTANASVLLDGGKKRKGSSSIASGPPWNPDRAPRFHEDLYTAVSLLIHGLGIVPK